MKTVIKALVIIIAIALICGGVAVVYKYTNGFNEEFKTFVVEYEGKKIYSDASVMELPAGKVHKFGVSYVFDGGRSEPRGYNVKIVPNAQWDSDFEYTKDGGKYLYSSIGDITAAFGLTKSTTYFELAIPEELTPQTLLTSIFPKSDVEPVGVDEFTGYPFMLVVSSYNNNIVFNIQFGCGETQEPPAEPGAEHTITFNKLPGNVGTDRDWRLVTGTCPATAKSGSEVVFEIVTPADNYKCWLEYSGVTTGKNYGVISGKDGQYSFIMPDEDITITCTISSRSL